MDAKTFGARPRQTVTFVRVVQVGTMYVRMDGFADDPMNTRRRMNASKLTTELMHAKNFNLFPQELEKTLSAFPNAKVMNYRLSMTAEPMPG